MFLFSIMAQGNVIGDLRIESAGLQSGCEALQGVIENIGLPQDNINCINLFLSITRFQPDIANILRRSEWSRATHCAAAKSIGPPSSPRSNTEWRSAIAALVRAALCSWFPAPRCRWSPWRPRRTFRPGTVTGHSITYNADFLLILFVLNTIWRKTYIRPHRGSVHKAVRSRWLPRKTPGTGNSNVRVAKARLEWLWLPENCSADG